jgi:hypothetical protein
METVVIVLVVPTPRGRVDRARGQGSGLARRMRERPRATGYPPQSAPRVRTRSPDSPCCPLKRRSGSIREPPPARVRAGWTASLGSPLMIRRWARYQVIQRLGETDAFLTVGDSFLELSPVAEDQSQVTAGHHGGKSGVAKPFSMCSARQCWPAMSRRFANGRCTGWRSRRTQPRPARTPRPARVAHDESRALTELLAQGEFCSSEALHLGLVAVGRRLEPGAPDHPPRSRLPRCGRSGRPAWRRRTPRPRGRSPRSRSTG